MMCDVTSRFLAPSRWSVLLALLLLSCSSGGGGPTTTVVEYWAGTKSERTQAIGACLEEKGWSFEYVRDATGELAMSLPADIDTDAFHRDVEECEKAGAPIKWPETQEEYRTWFEHWIERYRCMVDAGFDLEDAPSFDSWYEAMLAEEGYDVPYLLKNPNDLISAVRACPADPEAFW